MKARILSGGEVLGVFDLREGEYVIGSSPPARLLIESDSVAPKHARLKVGAYGAEIEDLGSGRGTRLGGVPLVGCRVVPSRTQIVVGDFAVEVWTPDFDHPMGERYRVGSVVAKGAMGVIRRAREASTGREVAMKQMHGELETRDAALAARFVQEARITAHLEHPNIVPVHDVSPGADGSRFYTMKMVRGVSLEEVVARIEARDDAALRVYPLEILLTIFQKVCDALAFAHSRGVIHRDLKPANIMVGEYGEVLVMDWGLAKLVGEAAVKLAGETTEDLAAGASATMAGTVMGTPHYMSPEQAGGDLEMVDERSDVYALGAILYELLTLRTPVEGETAREVLGKVRAGAIASPVERIGAKGLPHLPGGRIPASLAAVAMKALALAPKNRYASVPELQAEIRAYQSGFATGAEEAGALRQFALLIQRHRGVATAIAASVLLLTGLSVLYTLNVVREKNRAQASELRATQNEEAARLSAEAARKAQAEAESSARLARENEAKATASAELAAEKETAARLAEEKAKTALAEMLAAQNRTAQAEQQRTLAESSAKTAEAEMMQAAKAATEAKAETEEARKTRASQRIAALPAETDAAALRGDAGTVLVNSLFLLERETDPDRQTLHRRRIGAALQQMPRLLYLREGAQLARISPNGAVGVFFEGNKGTLFDPATEKPIGPSLKHGTKGTVEAADFGSDSRFLLTAGTLSPGQPGVWMWEAATGRELPLPRWRYEGNLESFLPYPDRSRILTVHAAPKSKLKELNLWFLDGTTPTARLKTPLIEGMVARLVPLPRTTQFFLQSFTGAAGDRTGFLHAIVPGSATLRCDPVRKPALEAAAAISTDASRAVQFTNRQLRLAEAPPPDASGRSPGPQVLSYPKGAGGAGVAPRGLVGEPQELLDAATGRPIGRTLTGGASVFSPDSKWLLMADGSRAFLHHALDNDAGLSFEFALPAPASALAFSADSARAIVVAEGGHVSVWSTKTGRRIGPDVLLPAEVKDVSLSESARFLFVSGPGISLWDTAPEESRPAVNFSKLSTNAVWVSGDGRFAVAIPPSAIPPSTAKGNASTPPVPPPVASGVSAGSLTLHDLTGDWQNGRTVARRTEIPEKGTCWFTRNGRFLLVWGGGEGAKIWDLEKRSPRDIFAADHPRYRPPKYSRFYDGQGVVVIESARDFRLGLAVEGARPAKDALSALFFEGTTGKELPAGATIDGSLEKDEKGLQRVADLDGKKTLAEAANRLRRELPADARRAFFSADEKLVAVLCTSAAEAAVTRPVLSDLLFHSDLIGKTAEQIERDGRPYGFTPPAGRAWRLQVYDVATGAALLGEVVLPALAAFRWEGERCVALSSEGRWTEIDVAPDARTLADLRDTGLVLAGRAIDSSTGEVAASRPAVSTLVNHWDRLRKTNPQRWQTGAMLRLVP